MEDFLFKKLSLPEIFVSNVYVFFSEIVTVMIN